MGLIRPAAHRHGMTSDSSDLCVGEPVCMCNQREKIDRKGKSEKPASPVGNICEL